MGKHTKQKNSRINLRALSTGALALGLLVTQTAGASAAVTAGAGNADSFERTAITVPLDTSVTPVVQAPANAAYSLNMQATGGVNRTSVEVKAEADRVAAEQAAAVEAERVATEAQVAQAQQVAATQAQQVAAIQQVSYNTAAPTGAVGANNTATPSAPVTSTGRSAAIYSAAMAQLGVNQDCTMLATNALAAAGINFHDWPAGYMSLGTITNNPVPGDLIYYADGGMGMAHIAVYAGPGANGQGMAIHGGFNGNSTVLAPAQLGSGAVFIHVA